MKKILLGVLGVLMLTLIGISCEKSPFWTRTPEACFKVVVPLENGHPVILIDEQGEYLPCCYSLFFDAKCTENKYTGMSDKAENTWYEWNIENNDCPNKFNLLSGEYIQYSWTNPGVFKIIMIAHSEYQTDTTVKTIRVKKVN